MLLSAFGPNYDISSKKTVQAKSLPIQPPNCNPSSPKQTRPAWKKHTSLNCLDLDKSSSASVDKSIINLYRIVSDAGVTY